MELNKKIGNLLIEIRKQKNLTQENVALKCNVHRTYIGMIERGEKNITVHSLCRLLKGLDMNLLDFFVLLNHDGIEKNENK